MKTLLRRIVTFRFRPATVPLFLLFLCMAAYAPLITRLGLYWDDFPMNWIATTMGGDGLAHYFSTNRPVWGVIYQLTTPLLGSRPIVWQLFALLLRWGNGVLLWVLLRKLWPSSDRPTGASPEENHSGQQPALQEQFAVWAAAMFVVYPGFSQQYIAFLYSHFYIVLAAFLLSLILMVLAVRQAADAKVADAKVAGAKVAGAKVAGAKPRRYALLTAIALLLSLLNMLSMEYFFLLDLLRPLLIWVVLSGRVMGDGQRMKPRQVLKNTLRTWLPYLAVFVAAMFWRSVLFGFQTYQPALMSRLRAQPVEALLQLVPLVFQDVWKTSALAWAKAFTFPTLLDIGARNLQRYWLLVAAGCLIPAVYLLFFRSRSHIDQPDRQSLRPTIKTWAGGHRWAWQPVVIGLAGLFIAGGPFWLTDLQIGLVFPNDRFTLPFMIGASLMLAGLWVLLPLPRWSKAVLLSVAFGFAIGLQYQYAITYSRDWSVQRSLFWQMVWRMPDLREGTVLLSNELPVIHYTDNSLTAPLNWTYDPANQPQVLEYALFYPTLRKETVLSNFKASQPIELDYLAAEFNGNTGQMVAFYYNPPGCLRVLDPQVDVYNWMVPVYLRESLSLTSTDPILAEPQPVKPAPQPPAAIFGAEIARGWCYYFEKADLARQLGDWQKVTELGDEAFANSDYPNDPLERFPFIEGYAHAGKWDRAVELTRDTYSISPKVMRPMVCKLWERITRETTPDPEKQKAMESLQAEMFCNPTLK